MDEKFGDLENTIGGWDRYKIYVIETLRRLRTEVDKMREKIDDDIVPKLNQLEHEISKLQVKSGAWGLLAGLLGVVIAMIIKSQIGE
jgi:hypothetical protein